MILDDIRLYAEMWAAGQRLSSAPGVVAAVDVGRFGLLVRDPTATHVVRLDIAGATGRWRVGGHRRDVLPAGATT